MTINFVTIGPRQVQYCRLRLAGSDQILKFLRLRGSERRKGMGYSTIRHWNEAVPPPENPLFGWGVRPSTASAGQGVLAQLSTSTNLLEVIEMANGEDNIRRAAASGDAGKVAEEYQRYFDSMTRQGQRPKTLREILGR